MKEIDDALVERMVSYIRRDVKDFPNGMYVNEGKAIVALLPEPVDPDWLVALEECRLSGWEYTTVRKPHTGDRSEDGTCDIVYRAIKRGRELERGVS